MLLPALEVDYWCDCCSINSTLYARHALPMSITSKEKIHQWSIGSRECTAEEDIIRSIGLHYIGNPTGDASGFYSTIT